MNRIGLTGGIGSGKTLICNIFESFGVPVFYADAESRNLVNDDPSVREDIIRVFGEDVYVSGYLDRKKMASLVFHDKNALQRLNEIVHPAVREKFDRWMEKNSDHPYIVAEVAILLESGETSRFDMVVTVSAPEDLRIHRVMKRDGINREDVLARIKNQLSEEERIRLADVVIVNDGTELVIPQVLRLHNSLI